MLSNALTYFHTYLLTTLHGLALLLQDLLTNLDIFRQLKHLFHRITYAQGNERRPPELPVIPKHLAVIFIDESLINYVGSQFVASAELIYASNSGPNCRLNKAQFQLWDREALFLRSVLKAPFRERSNSALCRVRMS